MCMDVISYLLGKKSGGGSETNLQNNKEVTITSNTTTVINPDENYDGMKKVTVTTNISGSNNNVLVDPYTYASTYSYTVGITSLITKIDVLDLSITTNLRNFLGNSKITTFPLMDTSFVTNMREMFHDCTRLKNVPLLDTSRVANMQNMFSNCTKLTDTSLDNILQMCISSLETNKTLTRLGFTATDYSASRIEALPHYQDFIDAGWTIGY